MNTPSAGREGSRNSSLPNLLFRAHLTMMAAFHLIVGLGLALIPAFPRKMAAYYGAEGVDWTPELDYIVKPLGVFMFVLGCLAVVLLFNPRKYQAILYAFVLLFLLRAVQRIVHADVILNEFGIAGGRNTSNITFFLCLALVTLILNFWWMKSQKHAG